jgi:hypothetical protein
MCDTPVPKLALSVGEFAASIGVGRRKGYEIAGKIGVRVDGRLLVPVDAAKAWLETLRTERPEVET